MLGCAVCRRLYSQAFSALQKTFSAHADESGSLSCEQLGIVLENLGAGNLDSGELEKIFATADLDSSNAIEFREFLICAALGCFLKISFRFYFVLVGF